jgi:hypothetical protein
MMAMAITLKTQSNSAILAPQQLSCCFFTVFTNSSSSCEVLRILDNGHLDHPTPHSLQVRKGLQNKGKTTEVRGGGEEHTKLVIVLQELLLSYRSADFDEYPRFSHEHSEIFKKRKYPKKPLLHSGS